MKLDKLFVLQSKQPDGSWDDVTSSTDCEEVEKDLEEFSEAPGKRAPNLRIVQRLLLVSRDSVVMGEADPVPTLEWVANPKDEGSTQVEILDRGDGDAVIAEVYGTEGSAFRDALMMAASPQAFHALRYIMEWKPEGWDPEEARRLAREAFGAVAGER